jgi:protein involved in polysaccharide export with SLBB domain
MKQVVFSLVLLAAVSAVVSAQTQTRQRLPSGQSITDESNAVRTRVVGPKVANHAASQKARTEASSVSKPEKFVWGNLPVRTEAPTRVDTTSNTAPAVSEPAAAKLVQPTVFVPKPITRDATSAGALSPAAPLAPAMYIVGAGDVLDISLPNTTSRESTLFTVLKNGTIEYPLLNGPLVVAGMSTDQIGSLLAAQIKVLKTSKVNVSVRDYASHSVLINGLVDSFGKKALRRESMPLYAILAEASIRPEATTATITHNGKEGTPLSLKDESAMSTLIYSGDAVRISGDQVGAQYVYVGGDVTVPGEKTLRPGMTLTQVLISAGADLSTMKVGKISRRSASGLLSTVEYDISSIAKGKTPDPQVLAGDRIEVKRGK